jgi:acyl carrier protein
MEDSIMTFETLRDVICETLGCEAESVTLEASLKEDLDCDSLAAVELVMHLEEETGISIPDEDMVKFKLVGDIMTYLQEHQA